MQESNSWDYKRVFQAILRTDNFPKYLYDIAAIIVENGLDKKSVLASLANNGIEDVTPIKEDLLDLLLAYLNVILEDHYISEKEYLDFGLLKILFKIREGDFYSKRFNQVKEILLEQVSILWEENNMTPGEALLKVNLQDMFSLSYDQFSEFEKIISGQEIRRSVKFFPKMGINRESTT